MAQIPTSSITMAAIATEVGVSTSSISMANLRTNSISYTAGSGGNTNAAPDMMRDWANYLHAQSMGTIDYDIRMGTTSQPSSYGLSQISTDSAYDDSAHACGGITLFRTHDGSNTYIKVKFFGDGLDSRQIYDTSNTNGATATTGTTVITIPKSDVTITATVTGISGDISTYPIGSHPSGATTISGTGAALLVCRGADQVDADPIGSEEEECKFHIALSAAKTGYTTTLLNKGITGNGIIVHSNNNADADGGE